MPRVQERVNDAGWVGGGGVNGILLVNIKCAKGMKSEFYSNSIHLNLHDICFECIRLQDFFWETSVRAVRAPGVGVCVFAYGSDVGVLG